MYIFSNFNEFSKINILCFLSFFVIFETFFDFFYRVDFWPPIGVRISAKWSFCHFFEKNRSRNRNREQIKNHVFLTFFYQKTPAGTLGEGRKKVEKPQYWTIYGNFLKEIVKNFGPRDKSASFRFLKKYRFSVYFWTHFGSFFWSFFDLFFYN